MTDIALLAGIDDDGNTVILRLNADGTLSGGGGGGGGGTVTSVGITVPSILTATGTPVTTSGTFAIGLATQTANTILAGPNTGADATPTFRALVSDDIPALDAAKIASGTIAVARLGSGSADSTKYLRGDGTWQTFPASNPGTVTSVGLSVPGVIFSVANTPVTSAGTIALSLLTQVANRVFVGPASGADATPTFRALVEADLGTGTGTTGKFLRGDMAWTNTLIGTLVLSPAALTGQTAAVESLTLSAQTFQVQAGSTITNDYQVHIGPRTYNQSGATGTVTTAYGLFVDTPIAGTATVTRKYSIGTDGMIRSGLGIVFAGSGVLANSDAGPMIGKQATSSLSFYDKDAAEKIRINMNNGVFSAASFTSYGLGSPTLFGWGSTDTLPITVDTALARLAAANIRIGLAPSASPIAQTLTIGEASRPGTDTNVAGANGTIQSGLGTGNATGSSLIFQTPTATSSGSGVQTLTTRMTILTGGIQLPSNSSIGTSTPGQNNTNIFFNANGGIELHSTNYVSIHQGILTFFAGLQYLVGSATELKLGAANSATPTARTFQIGESSRAGTDSNVAGSDGTIRSGLGTGTGTVSNLIFQTPTGGSSGSAAQTYATRLTLSSASALFNTPTTLVGTGSVTVPALGLGISGNEAITGWSQANGCIVSVGNGNMNTFAIEAGNAKIKMRSDTLLGWVSSFLPYNLEADLKLARLAAANLRIGAIPSASPIAQVLTIGEASRPGTDSNVAGADGTIQSGLGTGTGTVSNLIFQTPTVAGAGSGAQTYATRLTINSAAATSTVPVVIPIGSSSAPSLAFAANLTTGVYSSGTNAVDIAAGGANAWRWSQGTSSGPAGWVTAYTLSFGGSQAGNPDRQSAVVTISTGLGTGSGAVGEFIFKVTGTGAASTTANALATAFHMKGSGLSSAAIGFFGVTPVARVAAYTPTNVSADRSYDANATTIDELADVVGTLIADLQSYGLLQ